MSFIFASGGGRLGNQIINIINLTAFAIENNIVIYKLNDNYIFNDEIKIFNLFLRISEKESNWVVINNSKNFKFLNKFKNIRFRFIVRLLHLIFYFCPSKHSIKYSSSNARTKYIIAENITDKEKINELILLGKHNDIIFSGWGLRNWNLVLKHKKKIKKIISDRLLLNHKNSYSDIKDEFLLVHIRNNDFARFYPFNLLIYDIKQWTKAINFVCKKEKLKTVKLFTDDFNLTELTQNLKDMGIDVLKPSSNGKDNNEFLNEFIYNSKSASSILCNSSSLSLSLAFVFHNYVYTPHKRDICRLTYVDKLHITKPHMINWR